MSADEVAAALKDWWESHDGWIEGDPRQRGIDHSLNWPVIVAKIRELSAERGTDADEERFNPAPAAEEVTRFLARAAYGPPLGHLTTDQVEKWTGGEPLPVSSLHVVTVQAVARIIEARDWVLAEHRVVGGSA